ncbi:MAG: hypothetical protein WAM71_22380 [Candidatus Korobacteraceae bacterium]
MKLLSDDLPAYHAAVALLAVHTAIALNDAILTALARRRLRAEAHENALAELEHVCAQVRLANKTGLQHLSWLLQQKTAISYSDERFGKADQARLHAERFVTWAYHNFREVLRVQTEA